METTKIQFEGISRQLPFHKIPDGALDELINMRFDNSRLEPIGTKTVKHGLPDDDFSKIWIHEQDDFTNYIGLDTSNNLRLINESVGSSIIIKVYSSTVQVQFLKRFMIVIPSSGNEIDKYIYKDGSYVELNITKEPAFKLSTTDDYYETDFMYVETAEGLRGKFFEKMNSLSDDNYFASGMMFRAAYKLFDGSYVLHTIPYFLGVENYLFTLVRSSGAYTIKFYAAKGKITFTTGDYSGMDDLKDVIQSVSLFATKMETFLEISEDTITDDNLEEWLEGNKGYNNNSWAYLNNKLSVSEDFQKLPESASWYKIYDFDFSQIVDGDITDEELDLKSFYEDYMTRETLSVDQFSHHVLTANITEVYNSRLILTDTVSKLAEKTVYESQKDDFTWKIESTELNFVKGNEGLNEVDLAIKFIIDTEAGEKDVWTYQTVTRWYNNDHPFYDEWILLEGIIGYPDSRAKTCKIYVKDGGDYKLLKTLSLKQNSSMNYSYFYEDNSNYNFNSGSYQSSSSIPTTITDPSTFYNFRVLALGFTRSGIFQLVTDSNLDTNVLSDNIIYDSNRVQLSEVNNPFFFPAKNSYQVGTGKVIGVASNSEPLSAGQFGEHPLQIFTSKGVWALIQGSGDVLFSNAVPSSAEVANEGSILGIGLGVVFSNDRGIYFLQGRSLTELTKFVKGSPNTDFQSNANYLFYLDDTRLVEGVNDLISDIDIMDYAVNAKVGFDKQFNELYVTNSSKNYSYVYSFLTNFWYKLSESFSILINYYPHLYAVRDSGSNQGIISLSDETYDSSVNVLITTQPLKLQAGDSFKILHRTVLRTLYTPATGTHAGFYIFGSSDLINWQRLTGVNHLSGKKRDLLLTRVGTKHKYFIAVFAGKISQDSYVSSIDFQFYLKMSTKLR
jgi:hypothetical protein